MRRRGPTRWTSPWPSRFRLGLTLNYSVLQCGDLCINIIFTGILAELMPESVIMVKGVVDCMDLPLSFSRGTLQEVFKNNLSRSA